MKTRVRKWGNSLALRIPKSFAAEVRLEPDSPVEVSMVDGKLVITPMVEPALVLEELLAQITEHNLHNEVNTGPRVGNEVW